jgi:uroporphyrinogen decarboxylase
MNGKQRVKNTIDHKPSDRFPCSYEATYEVSEELIKYFQIDRKIEKKEKVTSGSNQPSIGGEDIKYGLDHELQLQKTLGVDQSIVTSPVNPEKTIGNWWGVPLLSKIGDGKILGAWNIVFQEWEYPYGIYIEIQSSPLVDAEMEEIKKVKLPPLDLYDLNAYREVLPKYKDFFVWMNLNGCFDIARFQRGSEQFFMDMAMEPKKAEILLEKSNEQTLRFFEKAITEVKGLVDGVYVGDDFGTQNGMVISPNMWRKYIKPKYIELISAVKRHNLKYCHHSCGGIRPIMPDLIEIGVDVLNPIQPLADGMDPEELGIEFGKDISFYGGIDEQRTLPNGTIEDVKNEVKNRINTLGKYNGYIVAPSHAFQPDTPIENVIAVYEAVLGKSIKI